jgi:DNA-binding transcriptional LysR family regulator
MNRLIIPRLGGLMAQHPRLELETVAESGNLSLSRRETDLAIRFARPQKGIGLCRRLGDLSYSVYKSIGSGATTPETPPEAQWITYEETHAHLPQARWISKNVENSTIGQLRVNDAESVLEAVKSGLGLALLPDLIASNEAGLQRVTDGPAVLSREVWLLVHPDMRQLPRVQAVIDWLDGLFI